MNYFNTSLPVTPKFVVMTGDLPPHNVWNQTHQSNLDYSMYISNVLLDTFDSLNIPVYPAIGYIFSFSNKVFFNQKIRNHEGAPVNDFPVDKTSWLYGPLSQRYSRWLSTEAQNTFAINGFYSQLVEPGKIIFLFISRISFSKIKKKSIGLRVISLNDNFCNNLNFWIYLNETDPANMLQWTINTLQLAEDNQEKVFILAHIPTGINDCVASWGETFYKIVNRYENTISAIFTGHTHQDAFEVFYENGVNSRATAISYISPSLTTYTYKNPSYRIYTVDQKTNFIVDTDTYQVNMTQANLVGTPSFRLEYNAKKTYNMTNLFPQDWANLITRFENDDPLFQTYYHYRYTSVPSGTCTGKCKTENICYVKSGSYAFYKECMQSNLNK